MLTAMVMLGVAFLWFITHQHNAMREKEVEAFLARLASSKERSVIAYPPHPIREQSQIPWDTRKL